MNALRIEGLSLQVRLGCSDEERTRPQEVRMTIEFRFSEVPKGAASDSLDDTICYAEVSNALKEYCESREFKLVERLALECLPILRHFARNRAQIGLSVHKVRPPVEGLLGGTFYRCGDFLT